ncbi:MAG: hypothetical protein QM658_00885 [Gordonia sp. (in: high G+C Gram-positive bacteria)]
MQARARAAVAVVGAIGDGEVAGFAAEWADQRATRTQRTAAASAEPADPEARAARRAARLEKMDAGADDFARWLGDLARAGLAEALRRPVDWWEGAAARLVDAQLPGLAERVRDTGADVAHGLSAPELAERVGLWWTLTRAWRRRAALDEPLAADLAAAVGLPTPTAQVRDGERIAGTWTVAGAHRDERGRLAQQRTWLRADDGRWVMLLETAGPGQSLGVPQLAGARLDAEVALYPGHAPRRGLFTGEAVPAGRATAFVAGSTVDDALDAAAVALRAVPWRDRHPVVLDSAALTVDGGVCDPAGTALPLSDDTPHERLLALTGGRAEQLFGELDGGRLRVLSVVVDGAVTSL